MRVPKAIWLVMAFGTAAAVAAAGSTGRSGTPSAHGRFEADGRVYGLPAAEVFSEDYAGPPVSGDAVTMAPAIAPLQKGNRTHATSSRRNLRSRRGSANRPGRSVAPCPGRSSTCVKGTRSGSR